MKAAFFDMDRTLVRVNTGRLYIRWRFERGEASLADAARYSVWIAQYTLGVIDPTSVTRRAVRTLEGVNEDPADKHQHHDTRADLDEHGLARRWQRTTTTATRTSGSRDQITTSRRRSMP